MAPILRFFMALGFAAGVFAPQAAMAGKEDARIADFFGNYIGRSISVVGEGLSERDLGVMVTPYGNGGFTIEWTTVIRYTDKKPKKTRHLIPFLPYRKRPGLYYAAVRRDMFGGMDAVDPLSGEPYFWAGLSGKILTISGLYIAEYGGYELQVYKRTLVDGGMRIEFSRIRDGKQLKFITGKLDRID